MAKLTPMMEQYLEIKQKCKHSILFFRLGDFYEMFYDDALIVSKELGLTLTGKSCGQEERAPMCGVPFHSADMYISKLVKKGFTVAICEQVEDPKLAKGIVKRDIIRVVTPGTLLDNKVLDETKNNYIACIYFSKNGFSLSICDVTTGEFLTTEFPLLNGFSKLVDEIAKFNPAEIICNEEFKELESSKQIVNRFNIDPFPYEKMYFDVSSCKKIICNHFKILNVEGMGLKDKELSISSSGALLNYLYETQKNDLSHIMSLKNYTTDEYMVIDIYTNRNLELTETIREKEKKGSLIWVIDKTKTAMGARLLRKWVKQPLCNINKIQSRLDAVESLKDDIFVREEIKDVLSSMYDFERIISKIIYQTANARDLISLKSSIENLPLLKGIVKKIDNESFKEIYKNFDTLEDICSLIEKSIVEDPPFTVREGGIIKEGFNDQLDIYFKAKSEGKNWINDLEEKEKELTGIKTLKIKFNKVFGYFIEVTKSFMDSVPERYIRKQTLANCERYTTTELNDIAELLIDSEEKTVNLEYDIFCDIRNKIADEVKRIKITAGVVSLIDCIQSLAEVAQNENYVKPNLNEDGIIDIKDGRHPVVEKLVETGFVSNDTYLDLNENRLAIITGPNMAGKSTYMRQVALIVLMVQMGSFVPAKSANISICDRIFTRVGASDDLSTGQSTFMVEMTEVSNILNNATENSLILLDEIGRGTSTFDGLSIAWSVLEYITDKKQIGAKTLFSTHYHELTELEGKLSGVKNYRFSVVENGDDIVFLRKVERGGANNSYGIQVAKLAGVPVKVTKRAKAILKQLNDADVNKKTKNIAKESKELAEEVKQIDLFNTKENEVIDEIEKLDIMSLSPMDALQYLFDLQKRIKGL